MNNDTDYVKVAPLAAIEPGKMVCLLVGGKRILLANDDGVIYAADEMCTHEDASLCTGSLRGHFVKCPLHGSRFDLKTGEPLEDPAETPLTVYPVKIVNHEIYIKIS